MSPEAVLPRYYIGIDAGGSKTLALLGVEGAAGAPTEVIGRGEAGAGNYQSVGAEASFAALEGAARAAWASAGLADQVPAAVCLGMAGVDRPADRAQVSAWALRQFGGAPVRIANDAQLVLAAGTPRGTGVAVICGTGSIAYAEDQTGRSARAGGWGYLLGDEGSGYDIGLAGMRAVTRAHDGRAPQTLLTLMILENLGLSDPTGLVQQVYRTGMTRAQVGALAVLVEQAAAQNDPAALEILARAADELALSARAVVRRLSLAEPVPCALAGGMFTKGKALREVFEQSIQRSGPALAPIALVNEPALGALTLAARHYHETKKT